MDESLKSVESQHLLDSEIPSSGIGKSSFTDHGKLADRNNFSLLEGNFHDFSAELDNTPVMTEVNKFDIGNEHAFANKNSEADILKFLQAESTDGLNFSDQHKHEENAKDKDIAEINIVKEGDLQDNIGKNETVTSRDELTDVKKNNAANILIDEKENCNGSKIKKEPSDQKPCKEDILTKESNQDKLFPEITPSKTESDSKSDEENVDDTKYTETIQGHVGDSDFKNDVVLPVVGNDDLNEFGKDGHIFSEHKLGSRFENNTVLNTENTYNEENGSGQETAVLDVNKWDHKYEDVSEIGPKELFSKYGLNTWFNPECLNPTVEAIIYWRDAKVSGIVFGSTLIILLSLAYFSLISVVANLGLSALAFTIAFRIYKEILQTVQKTPQVHPLHFLLSRDVSLPQDKVHEMTDNVLVHINACIVELRRLFLVENLIDSLKFGLVLWVLTYVGAWFNGLTLVIIGFIALFTLPKIYENNKVQIDQNIKLAQLKVDEFTNKIKEALPAPLRRRLPDKSD